MCGTYGQVVECSSCRMRYCTRELKVFGVTIKKKSSEVVIYETGKLRRDHDRVEC